MRHRSFSITAVAIALSAVGGRSLSAQAQLEVREGPIKRAVPLSQASSHDVSFMVFADGGTCAEVTASVLDVRDPLGTSLGSDALGAGPIGVVTADGAPVKLTVDIARFVRYGEYAVVLVVEGKCGTARRVISPTLALTRPAAEVNAAELSGRTLKLTRSRPWRSAVGHAAMHLLETSEASDVRRVRVTTQGVFSADASAITPGQVTARLSADTILAGTDAILNLGLAGLRAGSMKARVVVQSPSLSARQAIEVGLEVSDSWLVALICIGLGVVLALAASRLVTKFRPQLVNRLHAHELEQLIAELKHDCAGNSVALNKLKLLREQLRRAGVWNDIGLVDEAKNKLTTIQTELKSVTCQKSEEFVKEKVSAAEKAGQALKSKLQMYDWFILAISIAVAIGSGMVALYFGGQWGGGKDMLVALLWGFGVDSTVRGIGAAYTKVTTRLA